MASLAGLFPLTLLTSLYAIISLNAQKKKRLSVILTHTENYKVPYSVSRSMIKNTIEKSPGLQG